MLSLQGTRTQGNLRCTFADETQANGYRELAAMLHATADDQAGHAFGHLDYLVAERDAEAAKEGAAKGVSADTAGDLVGAMIAITHEHAAGYAGMARTAHDEGFEDIADRFLTLAKAGRTRTNQFHQVLDHFRHERRTATAGLQE